MKRYTNILEQVRKAFTRYQISTDDVQWVGCFDFYFTWEEFKDIADVEYDSGTYYDGCYSLARDLKIVGPDWVLYQECHGGGMFWNIRRTPRRPEKHFIPDRLAAEKRIPLGTTLVELNKLEFERS